MKLSLELKKLIIWATSFLHVVAFVLTGGYFYYKDDDSELKATVKESTYFCLTFFFIDLINRLVTDFMTLSYSSLDGLGIYLKIVDILKILVFVTLLILDLLHINLIHTPIGVRVHTNNIVIPSIDEDEFEEEDENEYVDEDGNQYQSNIFADENIE